jgi:hypothetical protein
MDICFICVSSWFLNKISESGTVDLYFTSKGRDREIINFVINQHLTAEV